MIPLTAVRHIVPHQISNKYDFGKKGSNWCVWVGFVCYVLYSGFFVCFVFWVFLRDY